MNRRHWINLMASALAGRAGAGLAAGSPPIQLHVDVSVDPSKEAELAAAFRKTFRPAISKQPGFVDVKLLKLRNAVVGQAPAEANYRLVISFQTEEQRQRWVASADHQQAWPSIERNLRSSKVNAILYDIV